MNYSLKDFDDRGWAHIHHAAFRGYVKSLDKFIQADRSQLEYETSDTLHLTPLLVAVLGGRQDAVDCLVRLGAKVDAVDARGHGVIELAVLGQNVEVLSYFLRSPRDELDIWTRMLRLLSIGSLDAEEEAEEVEEVEAVTACLRELVDPVERFSEPSYKVAIFERNFLPVLILALRSTVSDVAKETILGVICLLLLQDPKTDGKKDKTEAKEGLPKGAVLAQAADCGLITLLIRLLKSTPTIIRQGARILREFCSMDSGSSEAFDKGAIPALVGAVHQGTSDTETLIEVIEALGAILSGNPIHQSSLGSIPEAVEELVGLYQWTTDRQFLLTLTLAVVKAVHGHRENQLRFVDAGIASRLIDLLCAKSKDLQGAAVEAIYRLAEGNPDAQRRLKNFGVVSPLLGTLTKFRQQAVQQTIARALWAIAGDDIKDLCEMSERIGKKQLVELLSSFSEDLQLIGSEALGILSRFSTSQSANKGNLENPVPPLVRLLASQQASIVLSVLRTLRYLSVRAGYVVQTTNQTAVGKARGLKVLVALMVHGESPLIQAESAFTIASAVLGHQENSDELRQITDFSYSRVIQMLYRTSRSRDNSSSSSASSSSSSSSSSSPSEVRLLAGAALATFAYNNIAAQRAIAQQGTGGLPFSIFLKFLRSTREIRRCHAAFQVVVLSPIIHDVEPAISSAAGIRLIVDILQTSKDDAVLSLAADCVARLAHTRVGIPGAFVSIDAVGYLCDLLLSPTNYVRSNAVVALSYLSHNHAAKRQILARCRRLPVTMTVLMSVENSKFSEELLKDWKHFEQIGLPPIENVSTRMVASNDMKHKVRKRQPSTTVVSKSI